MTRSLACTNRWTSPVRTLPRPVAQASRIPPLATSGYSLTPPALAVATKLHHQPPTCSGLARAELPPAAPTAARSRRVRARAIAHLRKTPTILDLRRHFIVLLKQIIVLPRQARDKHRESTQKTSGRPPSLPPSTALLTVVPSRSSRSPK
jgi:hypothetical protein